jgi:hypothetical protein
MAVQCREAIVSTESFLLISIYSYMGEVVGRGDESEAELNTNFPLLNFSPLDLDYVRRRITH